MAPPCTCRPSDVAALKSSRILASLQKWSMGGYFLECCNSREAFERERGEEICVTEGNLSVHSTFEETRGVNVKRVFFFFFFLPSLTTWSIMLPSPLRQSDKSKVPLEDGRIMPSPNGTVLQWQKRKKEKMADSASDKLTQVLVFVVHRSTSLIWFSFSISVLETTIFFSFIDRNDERKENWRRMLSSLFPLSNFWYILGSKDW